MKSYCTIVTLCPDNRDFVPKSGKLRKQPDNCPENRVDFSLEPSRVTAVSVISTSEQAQPCKFAT